MKSLKQKLSLSLFLISAVLFLGVLIVPVAQAAQSQSGVGLQGTVSSPPPSTAATITIPTSGQSFTELPITVAGHCTGDVLVKLFKNNVFSGSAQCTNGSYTIKTDLFTGQNQLVARVFDALDQAGPDSNTVTVTFTDNKSGSASHVLLTSSFAKRGANPGEALTWPIVLSGGTGPYALSVDWGDGKSPDLKSQQFPGVIDISHTYDNPGVYNIVVKATDANGGVAFLQLVGVGNGALSQDSGSKNGGNTKTTTKVIILWQPAAILVPFILSTFWLGKRYELKMIRKRIEQGDRPF